MLKTGGALNYYNFGIFILLGDLLSTFIPGLSLDNDLCYTFFWIEFDN